MRGLEPQFFPSHSKIPRVELAPIESPHVNAVPEKSDPIGRADLRPNRRFHCFSTLVEHQVCALFAVTQGHLDHIPVDRIRAWERGFHEYLRAQGADLLEAIRTQKDLSEQVQAKLLAAVREYNEIFAAEQDKGAPQAAAVGSAS